MGLDWNRILSLFIGITYIIASFIWGDSDIVILILGYLVLPMGFIWFSEGVGGFKGVGAKGISISTETPSFIILIGGWLLLLLPVVALGIMKLN